jgi:hypothetical protein
LLGVFIDKLEGDDRPMDLAPSDFLKYSVGAILKRVFRVVRSAKTSATQDSLGSPIKCAAFLKALFDQLGNDLADHPTMIRFDAVYRLREISRSEVAAGVKSEGKRSDVKAVAEKSAVRWSDEAPVDEKKAGPRKSCSGFLGGQIGALRKDGRPYSCDRGKKCGYVHISVAGKTTQRLMDIISDISAPTRDDLQKAIQKRKGRASFLTVMCVLPSVRDIIGLIFEIDNLPCAHSFVC